MSDGEILSCLIILSKVIICPNQSFYSSKDKRREFFTHLALRQPEERFSYDVRVRKPSLVVATAFLKILHLTFQSVSEKLRFRDAPHLLLSF